MVERSCISVRVTHNTINFRSCSLHAGYNHFSLSSAHFPYGVTNHKNLSWCWLSNETLFIDSPSCDYWPQMMLIIAYQSLSLYLLFLEIAIFCDKNKLLFQKIGDWNCISRTQKKNDGKFSIKHLQNLCGFHPLMLRDFHSMCIHGIWARYFDFFMMMIYTAGELRYKMGFLMI